jgi:glycerophosphoryl diester phosphodiesterase
MWVNVEIKNDPTEPDFDPTDSIADDTMELLVARGEHDRWLISSFRIETVDRCQEIARRLGVPIRTAWLATVVPDDVVELLTARGHVQLLGRHVVEQCRAAGIAVNTWTCDDPERMAELVEWGIDGICTNVPDVALSVLGRSPA